MYFLKKKDYEQFSKKMIFYFRLIFSKPQVRNSLSFRLLMTIQIWNFAPI